LGIFLLGVEVLIAVGRVFF